jgi:hypothetical protein
VQTACPALQNNSILSNALRAALVSLSEIAGA